MSRGFDVGVGVAAWWETVSNILFDRDGWEGGKEGGRKERKEGGMERRMRKEERRGVDTTPKTERGREGRREEGRGECTYALMVAPD